MPERFDEMIQATLNSGAETHHEVTPADFGEYAGRRTMFTRCLAVVTQRYPDIRISISGESAALINMGLIPRGEMLVGQQLLRTTVAPTSRPGMVRLTFSRRNPG